ncbi:MAG: hypothetical protein ABJ004_02035 [Cyclobacteriaceae bacterium]
MKTPNQLIAILSIAILVSACSQRVMDFTIVSTKNVELSKFSQYERGTQRVNGEDKRPIIIIIPTGLPSAKEAIDMAIESVPGAVALLDGVVDYSWFYIPYIYGEYVYKVEGLPLIDPALAYTDAIKPYSLCILNKKGELEKIETYSEKEFYDLRNQLAKNPIRSYKKLKNG